MAGIQPEHRYDDYHRLSRSSIFAVCFIGFLGTSKLINVSQDDLKKYVKYTKIKNHVQVGKLDQKILFFCVCLQWMVEKPYEFM